MTGLPASPALELELDEGWLTVWFPEPEARNPLTAARVSALVALCAALKGRRDVRGVTFRGRGGMFCAGGDLKGFRAALQGTREEIVAMSLAGAEAFAAVAALEQVTVMAVEGFAVAGGFGLCCCGDMVIADRGARFAMTEVRIGIVPAQIAPYVLARLVPRDAHRLMLTAAQLDAEGAKAAGLVDEVTQDAQDMEAALAGIRAAVLACGPGAVAATKALIHALPGRVPGALREAAAGAFADALLSEEGREGVASFLEKRKPSWAPR